LDRRGWTEAEVARQGGRRIRVDIPGVEDAETAIRQIGSTARLTFRSNGDPFAADNIIAEGHELLVAERSANQSSGYVEWGISIEFNSAASARFRDATEQLLGLPIYIFLDTEQISAPRVNEVIRDGKSFISGSFTAESAAELASLIKSGALPFNLDVIQHKEIGAKLGANSLESSLWAGLIGVLMVILFMIVVYRLAGVMASIALMMYTGLLLVLLSAMGITLTLPGIAGIILSIGMATDANIIIFERLKEELLAKKTLRTAVDHAFRRALSAIFDSNITTLLVTLVLFWFGTGPVKGFAQTLALGTVISMFTAIVVTRTLLKALVKLGVRNPALFRIGMKPVEADGEPAAAADRPAFKIVEKRKKFYTVSACLLAVGVVFMIINGATGRQAFNLSVEFTGGLAMTLDMGEDFSNADISNIIHEVTGERSPQVQRLLGTNSVSVKLQTVDQETRERLISRLTERYPNLEVDEVEDVSATIGAEMQRSAIIAVALACLAMLAYITLRFKDFGIGGAVVLGLLYDGLIVLAGYAIIRTPMNYAFIAAILTVLGYSINASIVMFDRLRENKKLLPNADAISLMNTSIRQTLTRSVFTTLTTLFTIVMIALLGVQSVREFLIPIIIGLLSGTYSSLFLVGGFWYVLSKKLKKA
jgi:SecD/SecF fusion protein